MLTLYQPTLPSLSQRLSIPITSILPLDLINFVNVPSTFTDVTQSCLISTTCHSYYVHLQRWTAMKQMKLEGGFQVNILMLIV